MAIQKYKIEGKQDEQRVKDGEIKEGSRVCGIAESFEKDSSTKSVLAGVVQRMDGFTDGFSFSTARVGGLDATKAIKRLIKRMNRPDVQFLILNGTVISFYNVIHLHELHKAIQRPIIALTYNESPGIEEYLLEMDEGEKRLKIHKKNGKRTRITLDTGKEVFIHSIGLSKTGAKKILNLLTRHGKRPEPVRLAKQVAHSVFHFLMRIPNKQSAF